MRTINIPLGLGTVMVAVCLLSSAAAAQQGEEVSAVLDGNRPYDLLLPPGAAGTAGLPLVIFLHNTDPNAEQRTDLARQSLDRFKKDYWPLFKDRKCIVAIPHSKGSRMWVAKDIDTIGDIVENVQKQYKTDPKKLILLGVGGGGQAALFIADHSPDLIRAVITLSAPPVVVRGSDSTWFYPNRLTLGSCPYFVANPLTQGSSLVYWRQVREKLEPVGASISIIPVFGATDAFLSPPKELAPWLDEVLAGKQPKPLSDPQGLAVAEMFKKVVAALPGAIEKAAPAATTQKATQTVDKLDLSVAVPPEFEHKGREYFDDANGRPLAEIKMEHVKDAVYITCDARSAEAGMHDVMAADEKDTLLRGRLYQVYATGKIASKLNWEYNIASITYPRRDVGWVSELFIHAWAPVSDDGKRWVEVLVRDLSNEPIPEQMATALKTVLPSVEVKAGK